MLEFPPIVKKANCKICREKSVYISKTLGICSECIRTNLEFRDVLGDIHGNTRKSFDLPPNPPKNDGIKCDICTHQCNMGPGESGFCGLRRNVNGKLESFVGPENALLHTYLDPLPTNCCASWFCPGGTGAGYPKYSHQMSAEHNHYNLVAFFYACNFNCLYCQDSCHKDLKTAPSVDLDGFIRTIERIKDISCICYFGGSPEPQLPFAINASLNTLDIGRDVMRICWEWNGCGKSELVEKAARISLESGGNVKFDLKCFNPNLSLALTGVSNQTAYENFKMVAEHSLERPELPLLTATTLLVPGYVDEVEVSKIAKFISDLNDEIPYSLLVFHPDYMMMDMPITPKKQVFSCLKAAKRYLKNVYVGNVHFLEM